MKLNIAQTISRCSEIIAGDWLGNPEQHHRAEEQLNRLLTDLLENQYESICNALDNMQISFQQTVIREKLDSIAMDREIGEVSKDELQAMFDSGHAVPFLIEGSENAVPDSARR